MLAAVFNEEESILIALDYLPENIVYEEDIELFPDFLMRTYFLVRMRYITSQIFSNHLFPQQSPDCTITDQKKHQYWNHWAEQCFIGGNKPDGVTGPRLRRMKPFIWSHKTFWEMTIGRYGAIHHTPEELAQKKPQLYQQLMSEFYPLMRDLINKIKE